MKKFLIVAWNDFRNLSRDGLLILMYCIPLLIATLFRFGIPLLAELVHEWVDLTEHYAFIMSFLAILTPSFIGMIMGFMLLDDRDADILSYTAVTPLQKTGYLLFKIAYPVIISFVFMYVLLMLANLTPVPVGRLVPVGIIAALEAPLLALFLAAFANNKVEGLAIYKLTSLIFLAPFIGYFWKSGWAYLAGILPPFWVSKAFLASFERCSHYWTFVIIGCFVHLAFILWMLDRFNRRIT